MSGINLNTMCEGKNLSEAVLPQDFFLLEIPVDENNQPKGGAGKIKKMRLFYPLAAETNQNKEKNGLLQIHYVDGRKEIRAVKNNEQKTALFTLFHQDKRCKIEHNFTRATHLHPHNWEKESVNLVYEKHDAFPHHRKKWEFITQGVQKILNNPPYSQQKVSIIDAGCGNGELLKLIEEGNSERQPTTALIGFDFNKKNIQDAKKNYSGDITFIEGNLLNIDAIVKEQTESHHENDLKLFIFCSSLTRFILPDMFHALQTIQKVHLCGGEDHCFILEGITEPLITPWMAKKIGYEKITSDDNFSYYKAIPEARILEEKLEKIKRSGIIDLSFLTSPEKILASLLERLSLEGSLSSKEKVLDLSFASLSEESLITIRDKIALLKIKGVVLRHWDADLLKKACIIFAPIPVIARRAEEGDLVGSSKNVFSLIPRDDAASRFQKLMAPSAPPPPKEIKSEEKEKKKVDQKELLFSSEKEIRKRKESVAIKQTLKIEKDISEEDVRSLYPKELVAIFGEKQISALPVLLCEPSINVKSINVASFCGHPVIRGIDSHGNPFISFCVQKSTHHGNSDQRSLPTGLTSVLTLIIENGKPRLIPGNQGSYFSPPTVMIDILDYAKSLINNDERGAKLTTGDRSYSAIIKLRDPLPAEVLSTEGRKPFRG